MLCFEVRLALCRDEGADVFYGLRGSGAAPHEELRALPSPLVSAAHRSKLAWWDDADSDCSGQKSGSSSEAGTDEDPSSAAMSVQDIGALRKAAMQRTMAVTGTAVRQTARCGLFMSVTCLASMHRNAPHAHCVYIRTADSCSHNPLRPMTFAERGLNERVITPGRACTSRECSQDAV